jgi:hypothetical protein
MTLGKTIVTAAGVGLAMMLMADTALAGRVGDRQVRQSKRIHQGVDSGQLTAGETRRLVKEQHRLQHRKKAAWSDGQLTAQERLRLEAAQDRASVHIYKAKHNDRVAQ